MEFSDPPASGNAPLGKNGSRFGFRASRIFASLMLSIVLGAPGLASPSTQDKDKRSAPREIEFADDLEAALAKAKETGLPVVVVFGAVWCAPCRTFDKRTLHAREVQELGPNFHWVYIDIDREISLARTYNVKATPTTVVLKADGTNLAAAEGAFEPSTFRAFLDAVRDPSGHSLPVALSQDEGHPTRLNWNRKGYRARAMCFSQIGYGPLSLPSQSPQQVLRLGLQPRTPSTLADGQWELVWTESFANIFNFEEDDFRLDYLTLNSILTLGYGLSDEVQVELSVGNLQRTNSFLDPITDEFHDLFGLGDSGRDQFPEGDNIIDLELQNGVEIEDTSSGPEATHVTLTLQHNVTCGTTVWPALAYSVSTRYDAGGDADLDGSSPFSVGVSGSAARRLGDSFYAYLGLGYNWYGPDESRGLPLADEQWAGLAALEWSYRSRRSLVLQYLLSEGAALDRDPFDDPSHELHFGWKGEIRPGTVLELGLIENIIDADNSPDFGLHFGLRHRF